MNESTLAATRRNDPDTQELELHLSVFNAEAVVSQFTAALQGNTNLNKVTFRISISENATGTWDYGALLDPLLPVLQGFSTLRELTWQHSRPFRLPDRFVRAVALNESIQRFELRYATVSVETLSHFIRTTSITTFHFARCPLGIISDWPARC